MGRVKTIPIIAPYFASFNLSQYVNMQNRNPYITLLLDLTLLLVETPLKAVSLEETLNFVFTIYNKYMAHVVCFTSDYLITNKALCDILRIPFIESASHILRIAVNEFLCEQAKQKENVENIIGKHAIQKMQLRLEIWLSLSRFFLKVTR